jgi:hypothetical protein
MAELIGQAQSDAALAKTLRERWLEPRRAATTGILERAIARGEIRGEADLQVLMDQLYAPIYFRLMMRHQPLEAGLAESLVQNVMHGALGSGGKLG